MKLWQKMNMKKWEQEKPLLIADGYELEELEMYHFRVRCDWSSVAVDIWPSTRKMMPLGTNDVRPYDDLLMTLASCFAYMEWGEPQKV